MDALSTAAVGLAVAIAGASVLAATLFARSLLKRSSRHAASLEAAIQRTRARWDDSRGALRQTEEKKQAAEERIQRLERELDQVRETAQDEARLRLEATRRAEAAERALESAEERLESERRATEAVRTEAAELEIALESARRELERERLRREADDAKSKARVALLERQVTSQLVLQQLLNRCGLEAPTNARGSSEAGAAGRRSSVGDLLEGLLAQTQTAAACVTDARGWPLASAGRSDALRAAGAFGALAEQVRPELEAAMGSPIELLSWTRGPKGLHAIRLGESSRWLAVQGTSTLPLPNLCSAAARLEPPAEEQSVTLPGLTGTSTVDLHGQERGNHERVARWAAVRKGARVLVVGGEQTVLASSEAGAPWAWLGLGTTLRPLVDRATREGILPAALGLLARSRDGRWLNLRWLGRVDIVLVVATSNPISREALRELMACLALDLPRGLRKVV